MDRPDDIERRGSNVRFRRRRAELVDSLRALLGPRGGVAPLDDADRAAALAVEARASHRAAEPDAWAMARRDWPSDERSDVVTLLHAIGDRLGARDAWLVLPGREPQVVALSSETVLDNPLGFAALADGEMLLLDQNVPAGLWLLRQAHGAGAQLSFSWELELWGEPWLSAATRAMREYRTGGEGSV
jgi:hypothetical protein